MSNETKKQQEHRVQIWDHPESKIAFLEQTLDGKGWKATIYPQTLASSSYNSLEEIKSKLDGRGYATKMGRDDKGQTVLHVHHLPNNADIDHAISELGLVKGSAHVISHVGDHIRSGALGLYHSAKQGSHYFVGNRAKTMASLYLAGDILSTMSFVTAKKQPGAESEKLLQKMFGSLDQPYEKLYAGGSFMSAIQSLIYMSFADEGSDSQLQHLKKEYRQAEKRGADPMSVNAWKAQTKQSHSPLHAVETFIRKYPIELGALAQIIGFSAVTASGKMRWDKFKHSTDKELRASAEGGRLEMLTAPCSILAWILLTLKPKEEDKEAKEKDPLKAKNGIQGFIDNPARISGALATGTSVAGIMAGSKQNNPMKMAGQGTWLLGDAAMFTMKSDNYGQSGQSKEDFAAEAAAEFISESPIVFGQEELEHYVSELSNYMAERMAADGHEDKKTLSADDIKETAHEIALKTMTRLANKQLIAQKLAHHVAQIVFQFPEAQQDSLKTSLSKAISECPGVLITTDEMVSSVSAELGKITHTLENNREKPLPKMHELAQDISSIVLAMPAEHAAENASQIFDVLQEHMELGERDHTHLAHAMKQQISENTGIPTSALTELERNINTPDRSLH